MSVEEEQQLQSPCVVRPEDLMSVEEEQQLQSPYENTQQLEEEEQQSAYSNFHPTRQRLPMGLYTQ